jgi:hypothetical protein
MNVRADIEQNLRFHVLERHKEACNIGRCDLLSIKPTLFTEIGPVREWGRITSRGRRLVELHGALQLAGEVPDKWLTRKKGRKYCLRP